MITAASNTGQGAPLASLTTDVELKSDHIRP
jgi:hypothetical protein